MKSIFNETDYREIVQRIENLRADAPRQWGKMTVGQMLAHCIDPVRVAMGEMHIKRLFIGRILGPFFRKSYVSEQPFKQGDPTANEFKVADARDFEKEKKTLLAVVKKLHEGGETNVTKAPHGFFGRLTPQEWGFTQWKHLDHHLRQFSA